MFSEDFQFTYFTNMVSFKIPQFLRGGVTAQIRGGVSVYTSFSFNKLNPTPSMFYLIVMRNHLQLPNLRGQA